MRRPGLIASGERAAHAGLLALCLLYGPGALCAEPPPDAPAPPASEEGGYAVTELEEPPYAAEAEPFWMKPAAERPLLPASVAEHPFYAAYLHDRLEVGVRSLGLKLEEKHRGEAFEDSFVGSITLLREEQDRALNRFFLQYKPLPYLGVGVSRHEFGVEAWDEEGTDGTVELEGPLFYLLACLPNRSRLTPYVEAGIVDYAVRFERSPEWGQLGNKQIVLDDTRGRYFGFGCDLYLFKGLCLDFYRRQVDVDDVTGAFYLNSEKWDDAIFTVSHASYGFGLKYVF